MLKPDGCYMCEKLPTSVEHVPAKCFFPETRCRFRFLAFAMSEGCPNSLQKGQPNTLCISRDLKVRLSTEITPTALAVCMPISQCSYKMSSPIADLEVLSGI
jgi:hypothetical protein